MARPRLQESTENTELRLLNAAEAEFARVGVERARLADISRQVGISRASLLYYFDTKDELYEQVVSRTISQLSAALDKILRSSGRFSRKLEDSIASYHAFLESHPNLALIIMREFLDSRRERGELLANEIVPIFDLMENFIRARGRRLIRRDFPVREAILQIVFSSLIYAAMGPMRERLWRTGKDHTPTLVRRLFFGSRRSV